MWENIRMWLLSNVSESDRYNALEKLGEFETTALHLACKAHDPPEDVIKDILNCRRETAKTTDAFTWIPLHYACANGASPEVLLTLLDAHAEGNIQKDRRHRTPLHFLLGCSTRSKVYDSNPEQFISIIQIFCEAGSLKIADWNGMIPIHYACAYGMPTAVIEVLVDLCPESVLIYDRRMRTAVHFIMSNPYREASPGVLRLLLSLDTNEENHKVMNRRNKDGHLPIHLLSAQASRIPSTRKEARNNASECLRVYLDAEPLASADFLTGLQALPDWLMDTAVQHLHVQNILNKKISQCFPTSILLLDGFNLCLIILCFDSASEYTIKSGEYDDDVSEVTDTRWDIAGLYFSVSYFMLREIVQVVSLIKLGSFKSWLFDIGNYLDLSLITLVLYFTMVMDLNIDMQPEGFRTGVAFTFAIAWISVISYLKSVYIDFSVFVNGVVYVVRRLAAFLMALAIILIAFAQMFTILYRRTYQCPAQVDEQVEYYPHCGFGRSFLRVFIMLVGAVDMSIYQDYNIGKILYVLFVFLVVILLSNVLIAVVTDSYGVIKNERASIVFWSNRLSFIAEMGAIYNSFIPISNIFERFLDDNESLSTMHDHDETRNSTYSELLRAGWKKLLDIFEEEVYGVFQIEFWLLLVLRMMTIIIIVVWIIIGLATAGWLWPPQVREWMFVQKIASISRADVENIISQQVVDLKSKVTSVREDLLQVIQADENDISDIKTESNEIRETVLEDMKLIKEIMTALANS